MSILRYEVHWPQTLVLLLYACSGVAGLSEKIAHCPAWLNEYKTFHDQNKYNPDAKYLIFSCEQLWCGGIGDRVRGMILLLRIAILSKRVFLARWEQPWPLENFLKPAEVDWRIGNLSIKEPRNTNDPAAKLHKWTTEDTPEPNIRYPNGTLLSLYHPNFTQVFTDAYKDLKYVWVQTNWFPLDIGGAPQVNVLYDPAMQYCFSNFLYSFADHIEAKIENSLKFVLGDSKKPYVAAHLRFGGSDTEPRDIHRGSPRFEQLLSIPFCAEHLLKANKVGNLTNTPILLVTDHHLLRKAIKLKYINGVHVVNTSSPHHYDLPRGATQQAPNNFNMTEYADSFVEMGILMRSKCAIWAQSGFSYQSMWKRGYDCAIYIEHCIGNATHYAKEWSTEL